MIEHRSGGEDASDAVAPATDGPRATPRLLAALRALREGHARTLDPERLPPGERALAREVNAVLSQRDEERAALLSFLGDAAHQLRTPLAVLSARLEAPGTLDVERARADITWMARLVDQLLSSARTRLADPARRTPVDLVALGRDIVGALAPLAIYRGRELAFECAEADAGERTVTGEAELLFEALSNLVENALAHAPEASVVEVRVGPGRSIHALDRGPGVPEAERDGIFGRFSQGSTPTAGGAGLGLAIVDDVMRRHDGELVYADREGGGACFSLRFEAKRSDSEPGRGNG